MMFGGTWIFPSLFAYLNPAHDEQLNCFNPYLSIAPDKKGYPYIFLISA